MIELFVGNKLLTANEVAPVLGVKPSTIMSWVYERRIPFVKFGVGPKCPVRFHPKILNEWIESNIMETLTRDERLNEIKKKEKIKIASKKTLEDFNQFVENL